MTYEVLVDEVVQPDVVVVGPVPYVIADTEVTTHSTEPSVHIDR